MKLKLYAVLVICVTSFFLVNKSSAQMKQVTVDQIKLLLQEKESRTPAQRKIGSQLLQASRELRGQKMVAGVNLEKANVNATSNGMVKVDMNADVTPALLSKITSLGGQIIFPSKEYKTIRAMVPLSKVETIAGYSEVKFIQTAILARTVGTPDANMRSGKNGQTYTKKDIASVVVKKRQSLPERIARVKKQMEKYMMVLGAGIANSQGDHSHRADDARNAYGFSGQGIKVGVLSDSYNALGVANADVLTDDLPDIGNPFGNTLPVTVLQDASGADEGRAMLQIIHDLAPKAQLYFATAFVSEAGFATNIKALRDAGCDIVIDDIGYYDEPVFQDGIVAKAVQYVVGSGGMYFSSAGNEGALALGTSGVWEGDFTDVGSPTLALGAKAGTVLNFGTPSSPIIGDSVLSIASSVYNLQWADPYGASTNDYDLFMINAAGAVKYSSTTSQTGTQDPYEQFAPGTLVAGDRLVVFKATSAAVRAIHLNTNRGELKIATSGQTHGHSAIPDAYCVAAIPATGIPFVSTNTVESFTSDGPRRMFYDTMNNPLVAGSKFTFADGKFVTRLKPDITAADGVATTLGASSGLNPFFGTSAAAPHAGAIAALLKSAKPSLTPAQIRTIFINTALDIQTPGYDNVSGYGVLQAYQAMVALAPTPAPNIFLGSTTITETASGNGNGQLDPGEIGNLLLQLVNSTPSTATNVTAVVTTTTPGVSIINSTINYGNILGNSSLTNTASPLVFAVNQSVACGTVITFRVLVTFGGGGPSPAGYTFTYTIGQKSFASATSALGSTPPASPNYTAATGVQTGRVGRVTTGVTATCAVPVPNPGIAIATGARQYDAYEFTNTTGASQCFTASIASPNAANIYSIAYTPAGFIPSTPLVNYLAEPAQSATLLQYSFTVAAGAKFTVVIHAVDSLTNTTPVGNEVGTPYTLGITYVACTPRSACTPVAITNKSSIPSGSTGAYYMYHFTATGGSGVYVDTLTGNLPAGLKFAGDSLSGIPTQAGTFAIKVKATDPTGCPSDSATYNLVITGIAPASVTATAGTPQTTFLSQAFATALQATVKDGSNNPLSGVNVIFTAPTTGASGTFTGGLTTVIVVTNASGIAIAPTFTANNVTGTYTVTASVNGVTPSATFSLTNACIPTVVTSNADNGFGTLRYIVANACANAKITFDPSITSIVLTSGEIPITRAMSITGPGANLLSISANYNGRIFNITGGANSVIDSITGLTLKDGFLSTDEGLGGGAILVNSGSVRITKCVLTNCNSENSFYGEGGAVDNEGGALIIEKSTIYNNTSYVDGGGITQYAGSLTLNNSTVAYNLSSGLGSAGGGLYTYSTANVTNATIYGNSATFGGNILRDLGNTTLKNCIVAGGILNNAGGTGPDIYGTIRSSDYNLFQTTTGGTVTITTTHNIVNTNPKLLPLAYYGGTVPTMLPMSSSAVVNAGDPTLLATTTDQRDFSRKIGTSADIGSVETNYTITLTAGTPQSTLINTAFAIPLQAKVTESGNNIAGDSVTFTAPATGASATFPGGTRIGGVVTNASGIAAITATANGIVGTYNVTGSAGTAFTPLTYTLTNTFIPVAFTGCPNVNLIISRPGYNTYNGEGVMMYNMDTTNGAATVIPGGPLKDSLTGRNIDVNGAGVNALDGFVYAIRDTINTAGTAAAPLFYRIGSNYANTLLGTLPTPAVSAPDNLAVVVPSAGTFDDQGNYYYIAMTGAYLNNSFTPSDYYIGKVSNVAALAIGNKTLAATFTKLSLGNGTVDFKASIFKTITASSGTSAGSGFQDIAYSNLYRSLYVYTSFPTTGSPNYSFQLLSITPATGAVNFYSPVTTFGAVNNEVAGISTTASGNLRVFMTSGDVYKPTLSGGNFTNTLVKIGNSGVPLLGVSGSVRGDLASCGTGATTLPSTQVVPPSITIGSPNQIVAYPNPAQGITTIAVGQLLNNAHARLLGIAGNVIAERSGISGYTFQFDMTGKPGGMYTVEVIQGGSTQQVKIIVP